MDGGVYDQAVARRILRNRPAGPIKQLPDHVQMAGRTDRRELGDALNDRKNNDMKQRQGDVLITDS